MTALYFWIFTSKWIKLLGHYLRYPVDVLLLPVSILFGYFHGAIKMYAVMTLNVVCILLLTVFHVFSYYYIFLICGICVCIQAQPLLFPVTLFLPMTSQYHNALITVSSFLQLTIFFFFPVHL